MMIGPAKMVISIGRVDWASSFWAKNRKLAGSPALAGPTSVLPLSLTQPHHVVDDPTHLIYSQMQQRNFLFVEMIDAVLLIMSILPQQLFVVFFVAPPLDSEGR